MTNKVARAGVITLLGLVALNAFGGGIYGISGAAAVPRAWLAGSPFTSYLVPSLILVVAVGGSSLVALIAIVARHRQAWLFASIAAIVLVGWIAIQVAIIGFVSPLQPAMAAVGVVVFAIANFAPRALVRGMQHART